VPNRPPEARRVSRPRLEVADIFRGHGPAWRRVNAGHVSLGQLKVMSAIESCRTAALGGHVARCEKCAHTQISYNCHDRHCPKCQGTAAKEWLAAREADLLPVPYFHVVFTLPAPIGDIARHNKAVVYDLLFKASAESLTTIAADPNAWVGARVGITSVLHSWGSAMTHDPHVHMIVIGHLSGIWTRCRNMRAAASVSDLPMPHVIGGSSTVRYRNRFWADRNRRRIFMHFG
jgi:hypothetical protein